MSVSEQSHCTVPAATLAEWVESHPDRWWFVDGDPRLTAVVDFPCPSDELAPAIRKIGKDLRVLSPKAAPAHGTVIGREGLDELSDTANRLQRKTLLLSWADTDAEWLLMEDEPLA